MGLLSGLEKFGLNIKGDLDITEDGKGKKQDAKPAAETAVKKVEEKDLVLEKHVTCPVCDYKFTTLMVKTTKAKRLEPDNDLRPNHEGIDTLKYEVCSCPSCGYSAMNKFFEHVSTSQIKWVREAVCDKFTPVSEVKKETISYDESVDHYKLALVCAIAKHAKLSEKSLICLRISWLRRAQLKEMSAKGTGGAAKLKEYRAEMEGFYRQAYDGFQKVLSTETPPFCGMNTNTIEYLLANMAYYFRDLVTASKLVSSLLTNANTPSRVKDKCHDLKDKIVSDVKAQKAAEAAATAPKTS